MNQKLKAGLIGFISGLIISIGSVILWKSIGSNGYLSLDLAKTLFSALIQINATIIGFWGVVFVFYLKTLFDNRRAGVAEHFNLINKSECTYFEMKNSSDKDFRLNGYERIKFLDVQAQELEQAINAIDKAITRFVFFGVFVISLFLISIFFCFVFIGKSTESGVDTFWIFLSILPLLIGINSLFYGIWVTAPDTQYEEIRKEREKILNKSKI